jgi:hypothetical protein
MAAWASISGVKETLDKEDQAMKRLPPSATMREELDKLLRGSVEGQQYIVSALVGKVANVVQELLEASRPTSWAPGAATSAAAPASRARERL